MGLAGSHLGSEKVSASEPFFRGNNKQPLACWIAGGLLVALLSGCASYHVLPLPETSSAVPLSNLLSHGLDMQRAAAIAVARDPSLQAAWQKVQAARQEARMAGLLPYPTLSFSVDHPFSGPDHLDAWSLGLTESLQNLLTRADRHQAAKARYAARLLAWQWQRIQVDLKARCRYLDAWQTGEALKQLGKEGRLVETLLAAASNAHARGDMATRDYLAVLTQADNLRSRMRNTEVANIQARGQLAALLDVEKIDRRSLVKPDFLAPASLASGTASIEEDISGLAERRLDLLALNAGYQSQNARLRADILSQFPIVSIGFQRANDTAGVNTVGLGVTVTLPFFNDSRGKIAIDQATRKALHAEYRARLDQAINEVRTVDEKRVAAIGEWRRLKENASRLKALAVAADKAYRRGDITLSRRVSLRLDWANARLGMSQLRVDAEKLAMTSSVLLARPLIGPANRTAAEEASS